MTAAAPTLFDEADVPPVTALGKVRPPARNAKAAASLQAESVYRADHAEQSAERRPAPYVAGSETSEAAAAALDPDKRLNDCERIYRSLSNRGAMGATQDELSRALDLPGDTCRPRLVELYEAGRIWRNADIKRKTSAGRQAVVCFADTVTREAAEALQETMRRIKPVATAANAAEGAETE